MYIRIPVSFFLIVGAIFTTSLEAQPASVEQRQSTLPANSVERSTNLLLAQAPQEEPQIDNIEFVKRAIERSEEEIKLAELALEKSDNQTVRAFALQIISEHNTAIEKLQAAVGDEEVEPATGLAASQQKTFERLEQLSSEEYDLPYIEIEIKDLKSHLELYRREARKGNGTELEAIAARMLPKLEQQLVNAEDIKLTL